jgi:4,5-DOPA dioxygenase extradiol
MPALFVGHGSPTNALADNGYTRSLRALGDELPRPAAVLVVSAHWLTRGVRVLRAERPRTMHDFYGFPEPLYEIEYPAPGSPECAEAVADLVGAIADDTWGFDHASWSVLRHVFPHADVPMLELSLDPRMPSERHLELAQRLRPLRERGVLVVGSGNIVHNLSAVVWDEQAEPFDWAVEFDAWAAAMLEAGDLGALTGYASLGNIAQLAAPTNDHYLPLLYAAGLREDGEPLVFTHVGIDYGSVSMRCLRIG